MTRKILAQGILVKNDNDRYSIDDNWEITSGMVVEVEDGFDWVSTRVEWDGDYYFVELPMKPVWGSRVRLRDF